MRTIYQLLISFLLQLFVNAVVAQNITTTLGSFNSSSCAVGDTITLPVNVSMASNISTAAISMAIDYDTTKLRCISAVTNINSNISAGFLSNCGFFTNQNPNPPFTASSRRQFRAAWFSLSPVAFNGMMFNLRFVVVATGNTTIKWDLATPGNCEYADELAEVIPNCSFVDGSVTCGTAVPVNCDITLSSATGTTSQSVCQGSSITNITYSTVSAIGATVTGLPAGVTGVWTNNTVTISGTPTAAGTFNYTVTLSGCTGGTGTASGTITVNTNNSITLSSATGTNAQTITTGTAITPITYSTTGATGATVTGLPAGVTGSWASNTVTISGTPSTTGTFNYTVAMMGGCTGGANTASGSITVNAGGGGGNFTIQTTLGSFNSSSCAVGDTITLPVNVSMASGISTSAISMAIDYDTTKLRCISAVTNINSNISAGFLSNCGLFNSLNPNPPFTASSRRQFRAAWFSLSPVAFNGMMFNLRFVVVATGNTTIKWDLATPGNCEYADELAEVIPNCSFVDGSVTCGTAAPANCGITLSSATGTTSQSVCQGSSITNITYSTVSAIGATVTGLPAGVTGVWTNNTVTISGTPTAAGTFNYTVTLSGCTGGTGTASGTITVTSPASAGTLSGTQGICVGGTTTFTSTVSGGSWSSSATGIATVNASTGVVNGVAAGTAIITYTRNGTGGCANATATRSVTVTAPASAGTLSGTQGICVGGTTTFTSTVSGGSWSSSSTSIATVNASTGVVNGVAAGTAIITYTRNGTGGCANNATATRTVTVSEGSSITLSSASGTNAQALTLGTSITNIIYSAVGATGATFSGLPDGVNGLWSGNTITISGTPLTAGAYNYTVTLTGGTCTSGTNTAVGSITVNPASPNITTTIGTVSGCIGDTVTIPVTINMASGISTSAISLAIDYDTTKLQCISTVTDLNAAISSGFLANCGIFSYLFPNPPYIASTRRQFRAAWFNLTPVSINGLMFNLRFRVLATGNSDIKWDIATPGNVEFADEFAEIIPFTFWTNGAVLMSNGCFGPPQSSSLCLPSISTDAATAVGLDSALIGGNISSDGGSSIVLRGVCYSTSPNPNMGNQRTEDGSGIGSFNTVLRGLTSSTTYYARSYAKNSNGVVVYGNEVSFTTFICGSSTVSDVDNNIYNTVQIGTQCWTQSNLKVSKYRNRDIIPTGLSDAQWYLTSSGAFAIYNNDTVNDGLYGKLYNYFAVTDSRGLCPTGWHVPSDGEWTTLENFLGGSAGGALKSTSTQPTPGGWDPPNTGATNSSGFTALPGGFRYPNGSFFGLTVLGVWWSPSVPSGSVAWSRYLFDNNSIDRINQIDGRASGLSVRCVKDSVSGGGSASLPTVTTTSITSNTSTGAITGGNVTSDGGVSVTARGVAYGTSQNPTTANNTTSNGTGTGIFTSTLTGLTPSTTYYVRAYATNSIGTSYGNELSFITDSTSNCIFNPGTPNPWPASSAPSGGYIPLGNFGAQSRFSISMWIRPEINSGIRIIIDANHGGSSNWVIQTVNSGATWCWGNLCFSLQPSVWQHLLLTYDNGLRNCFINGVLSHSLNNPINYSGSPSLFLGNWPEGGRRFNGYIDELYITRDVLATSNFTPEQYITSPSSNTFRLFHFEEGTSTGTVDAITNLVYPLNNWIWATRP